MVDGSKSTQSSRALVFRPRKKGGFQSFAPYDRWRFVDRGVISGGFDRRDSGRVVVALRDRSSYRRYVLSRCGSNHGPVFYVVGRDRPVRAGVSRKLVDGGRLRRTSHSIRIDYREEVRWLNTERLDAK